MASITDLDKLPDDVASLREEMRAARAERAADRALLEEIRALLPAPAPLTVAEYARRAGLSLRTARRRIKAGAVPIIRSGRAVRVDPRAVEPVTPIEAAGRVRAGLHAVEGGRR